MLEEHMIVGFCTLNVFHYVFNYVYFPIVYVLHLDPYISILTYVLAAVCKEYMNFNYSICHGQLVILNPVFT